MLGKGIIKGMAETARNFFGSYVDKSRLTTVEYPEQCLPRKEQTRQFPFLVYDGDDPMSGLRCVACQICEKECPPQCIYIVRDTTKKPDHIGKAQFQPAVFDIDIAVCMSCQICVEVCPFDAIMMDVDYELSTSDRFGGLLLNKEQLAKPSQYHHKIHPTEAERIEVHRVKLKEKAAAKSGPAAQAKAGAGAQPPIPTRAEPQPAPAQP